MEEIFNIYGKHLINESVFMFKNMPRDSLRQWCWTNRIPKKVIELEGEKIWRKEGRKEGREDKKRKNER